MNDEYLLEPVDTNFVNLPLVPFAYESVAGIACEIIKPAQAVYLYHEVLSKLSAHSTHWRKRFAKNPYQTNPIESYAMCMKAMSPFMDGEGIDKGSRRMVETYYRRFWFAQNVTTPSELVVERFYEMTHDNYLKTTHWWVVRSLAVIAGGFRCERCYVLCDRKSSKATLHVHNLTYDRKGTEQLDDLQLLCAHCHAKEHGIPLPESTREMAWKALVAST